MQQQKLNSATLFRMLKLVIQLKEYFGEMDYDHCNTNRREEVKLLRLIWCNLSMNACSEKYKAKTNDASK